ncbi:WD40/YVTN/BNR-like repeat-containing protein [Pseudomonas helleri]|uniref:WD40/YVTN/BNR-like repeat-containing protein n=1 Tax=Pseudomonas helleri TaxID=1608996 RepID=UPI003816A6AD
MPRYPFWLALGLLGVSLAAQAGDASVSDVLLRPALKVSAPERAVLIDITRAGNRLVAVGERGLILLSDDNGQHWRQAWVPTSVSLTSVSFATAQQGWAAGHAGVVLHTADGGEHWTLQLDGKQAAQRVLDAVPAGNQQQLKVAQRLVADGADKPWLAINFSNDREGTVVGAFGLILHTTDGGATWQSWVDRLPNPAGNHLYAIAAQGPRIYLAAEQGNLWTSADGGASFTRLNSPYDGSFFAVDLAPDGDVLVAGLKGNVWRSSDQGEHWQDVSNPFNSSVMAARSLGSAGVLLADQSGHLLLSTAGAALREQGQSSAVAAFVQATDGQWITVGARGIQRVEQVKAQ